VWETAGIVIAAIGGAIAGVSTAVRLIWESNDRKAERLAKRSQAELEERVKELMLAWLLESPRLEEAGDGEQQAGIARYTEAEARGIVNSEWDKQPRPGLPAGGGIPGDIVIENRGRIFTDPASRRRLRLRRLKLVFAIGCGLLALGFVLVGASQLL
jgi:hypothetical protein